MSVKLGLNVMKLAKIDLCGWFQHLPYAAEEGGGGNRSSSPIYRRKECVTRFFSLIIIANLKSYCHPGSFAGTLKFQIV